MTDLGATRNDLPTLWKRIDKAWLAILILPLLVALFAPSEVLPMLGFAGGALAHTGIFIAFAVLAVAYLKASGAEALLAQAFVGREMRMIVLAALFGGLSPFCSCEVIPFIAALLAVGAPLSAVMAFWLSSPLMDPPMFLITAGELGLDFALAKTVAAVSLGLSGGLIVKLISSGGLLSDPLKIAPATGCGCGNDAFSGRPVWAFWRESDRMTTFRDAAITNALFLAKWLLLAYMLEALMIRFIPADWIASSLGGDGFQPILLGALLGGPAYLNGYAAVPLISGFLDQGMSQGAAMSFMLAGGVSCIPAAVAVWALVKPKVFFTYLGIAFTGSLVAGMVWQMTSAALAG
ncbi:MAG: permease [Rhodobacteraceae bacterium]|nr:permease [Paracoccaceae bacterium]